MAAKRHFASSLAAWLVHSLCDGLGAIRNMVGKVLGVEKLIRLGR